MKVEVYRASEDSWRRTGEKAQGLLDLERMGLRVPNALIFAEDFFDIYAAADAAGRNAMMQEAVRATTEFFRRGEPTQAIAFRCGAKGVRGKPRMLPESVLNLGVMDDVPRRDFLRDLCEAHAKAFFAFFGGKMPAGFSARILGAQLKPLLSRLYEYFLRHDPPVGRSIILQRMVFGDLDERSLTGMCYTRHPHSGVEMDYGHFILRRQGLSLGGVDSPLQRDMAEMPRYNAVAYEYLKTACRRVEAFYRDVRAMEYTAEGETMYILQNTVGNRTFRFDP